MAMTRLYSGATVLGVAEAFTLGRQLDEQHMCTDVPQAGDAPS